MSKPVVMTPEEEDRNAGVTRSFDGVVHSEETPVKVLMREFHHVTSEFTYLPLPSEIIKHFGSMENFEKCFSEGTEGEYKLWEFLSEIGHDDRVDDMWTERKGGYESEYELIKND
jgi:hypothetical protein